MGVRVSLAFALLATAAAQTNTAVAKMRGARVGTDDAIAGTVTFEQSAADPLGDITVTVALTGMTPGQTHGFHVHQFGDTRITQCVDFPPAIPDADCTEPPPGQPRPPNYVSPLITMSAHFVPYCVPPEAGESGDITGGCSDDQVHGLPPSQQRQPGDMGNIIVEADGTVTGALPNCCGQQKMSLTDPLRSIVGRVVVVHANEDKPCSEVTGSNDPDLQQKCNTELQVVCNQEQLQVFCNEQPGGPYGRAGGPIAYGVIGIAAKAGNAPLAPKTPKVDKIICKFEKDNELAPTAPHGEALLTLLEPERPGVVRMQAKINGLKENSDHSFHFHEYGDMTADMNGGLGAISSSNQVNVDMIWVNEAGTALYDVEYTVATSDLVEHVGRSLTIHDGPTKESPTIAAATCGLANPNAKLDTTGAPTVGLAVSGGVVAVLVITVLVVVAIGAALVCYMCKCALCSKLGPKEVAIPPPPPPKAASFAPPGPPPPAAFGGAKV